MQCLCVFKEHIYAGRSPELVDTKQLFQYLISKKSQDLVFAP